MRKFLSLIVLSICISSVAQETEVLKKENVDHFMINAHIGQGFRTAEIVNTDVPDVNNLQEKLLYGRALNFDLRYFNSASKYTLGLKINHFSSDKTSGFLNGYTSIGYYAFTFGYYDIDKKIGTFNMDVSLGYIGYITELKVLDTLIIEKGGNLGASLSVGYDFKITKNIYFGPNMDVVVGNVKNPETTQNGVKLNLSNGQETKVSLTRVDLNAHLTFVF